MKKATPALRFVANLPELLSILSEFGDWRLAISAPDLLYAKIMIRLQAQMQDLFEQ